MPAGYIVAALEVSIGTIMESVYIAGVVFALWGIFVLPTSLWTVAWEVVAATSTKDVETPGITTRVKRFTDLAKVGGPAVLAVLAGAMVNFGVSWILSGNVNDQLLGAFFIFGSVVLAMLGSLGIVWLLSAGGYSPNSFSALRADIQEGAEGDHLPTKIANWIGILERLQARMLAMSFQVTSSKAGDKTDFRNFDVARLTFPGNSPWKNFFAFSKVARTAEKFVLSDYSSVWCVRWHLKNWILWASLVCAGTPIVALIFIPPEASYSAAVLLLALMVMSIGHLLNRLRRRAFAIASTRRYGIFRTQEQQCVELLQRSRARVAENQIAEDTASEIASTSGTGAARGLVRRTWDWLW